MDPNLQDLVSSFSVAFTNMAFMKYSAGLSFFMTMRSMPPTTCFNPLWNRGEFVKGRNMTSNHVLKAMKVKLVI
jgi:hypothetical protein